MHGNDDNLVQRLIEINTILRRSETSVIVRYGGIAELALFRDVRKVGVLTVGLIDENPQVRVLAAEELDKNYDLGETSREVLALLDNNGAALKEAYIDREQDRFAVLLDRLGQRLRLDERGGRRKQFEDGWVEYDRRHVLTILRGLGRSLKKFQAELGNSGPHPLKRMLEEEKNRWILALIQICLEKSEDIFCRRGAIAVVGELGIDFNLFDPDKQAYGIIRNAIDSPNNRHDYLVTRDGIQALTALVKQNPSLAQRFYADSRSIFSTRDYQDVAFHLQEWHRHYTRQDCVNALAELHAFEEIKRLLQDGEEKNFLHMMYADQRPEISKYVKSSVIDAFLHIYKHESQYGEGVITPTQLEILDSISKWIGSRDRAVRGYAIQFFEKFPNIYQALAYLLRSAEMSDGEIKLQWSNLQSEALSEYEYGERRKQLEELLADRKRFVIVFGIIFARFSSADPDMIALRAKGYDLLRNWCSQRITSRNQELEVSKSARLEALWMLYELDRSAISDTSHPDRSIQSSLGLDEIATLRTQEESDASFLCVLELFRALYAGEQFIRRLSEIAISRYPELVRVCAKIELLIQYHRLSRLKDAPDLSIDEVKFIAKKLKAKAEKKSYAQPEEATNTIHDRLVTRFIPVLANMDTQNAIDLVGRLLDDRIPQDILLQLREGLDGYHCYKQHARFFKMLLQHLSMRHNELELLRLDYLNLLRAGEYQQLEGKTDSIQQVLERPDPFKQKVLARMKAIARDFQPLDLPVLFSQETERVVALESLSSESIHTLLYAVDGREEGKQIVKGYVRTQKQKFEGCWVFLERVITDLQIAQVIRDSAGELKIPPQRPLGYLEVFRGATDRGVIGYIVGKVVDADDRGVYVDVGLRQYEPFVPKAEVVHRDEPLSSSEWLEYAATMEGSYLVFRVNKVTFDTRNHLIVDMELTRRLSPTQMLSRGDFIMELLQVVDGKTLQATIKEQGLVDRRNPVAIFRAEGRDLEVPFRELSWRRTSIKAWVEKRWQEEFESRPNQVYELRYRESDTPDEKGWSLRDNTPTREYFVQLLYQKGTAPFSLTYAKQAEQGHIFEIEPGRNCYVPADRLILSQSDRDRVIFLLPNRALESGDILHVKFEYQRIKGQPEVVLRVLDIEQAFNKERLPRGMKIVGRLAYKDRKQPEGRLEPYDPSLKQFTITIEGLPAYDPDDPRKELGVGSEISGYIVASNVEDSHIRLRYAPALPAELKKDQIYPCRVKLDPRPDTGYMMLSYANVTGILRERDMTYRHTPVLAVYQRGQVLKARVTKQINWDNKDDYDQAEFALTAKHYDSALTSLGLKQRTSVVGDVVMFYQGKVRAVQEDDGRAFEFSLQDFTFSSAQPPRIEAGNRIEFLRDSKKDMHLTLIVKRARVVFTILPRLDHSEDWSKPTKALPDGKAVDCVYVHRNDEYAFFESKPGEMLALSLKAVPWLLTDRGEQADTEHVEIEVMQAGGFQHYPLSTGDFVTLLRCDQDEIVQLKNFRQGPLHFVANPGLLEGTQYPPIPLSGKILPSRSARETGKLVELTHYTVNGEKQLLRSGIVGFYREDRMSLQDQQLFKAGRLKAWDEVKIVLRGTPTMRTSGLWLPLLDGDKSVENLKPQTPLEEKLKELAQIIRHYPQRTFEGKIKSYHYQQQAFLVSLDEVGDDQYTCWLLCDQVSFNPDRPYRSIAAFSDGLHRKFTILEVDVKRAELQVSLIQNSPIDVDETGDEESWVDGQLLKHATFIRYNPRENAAKQSSESVIPINETDHVVEIELTPLADAIDTQTEESNKTQSLEETVILEITPGLIVAIPVERFYVDGLPFLLHDSDFRPRAGDQVSLRVVKDANQFGLDVITSQPARVNVLSNKRRVVSGWVGKRVDEQKIALKLVGFELPCFLDSEQELTPEELIDCDLFRFIKQQEGELYFRAVKVVELKQGDILHVVYKGIAEDRSNCLKVTFGNKRSGYIRYHDISYQANFKLSDFHAELDYEFDATVVRDVSGPAPSPVLLSIREAPTRHFRYFQESLVQQKLAGRNFSTVLVRHNPDRDFIDVEISDVQIEPGTVIRVPYQRMWISRDLYKTQQELIDDLMTGDLLQFKLQLKEGYAYLQLVSLIKSLLHDLTTNTLVRVQLTNRSREGHWFFSLSEYDYYSGVLLNRPGSDIKFFPGVLSDDMRLVVAEEAAKKVPSQAIRLRQRTLDDLQLVVRVRDVGMDYIEVMKEDGQIGRIYNRNATYRVNSRASYLKQSLPVDKVIIVTQRKETQELSLLENNPAPFGSLRKYLHSIEAERELLELTYIRTNKEEDHIFELRPGELYTVPVQALYFYDHPLRDFYGLPSFGNSQRFLPGDVFKAFVERPQAGGQDELQVVVTSISLSALHFWHPFKFVEAEIVERSSTGVVIKADDLEEFVDKNQLLPGPDFDALDAGDKIWLQVIRVDVEARRIILRQVSRPSWQKLRENAAEGKRVDITLYGKIVQLESQRVILEILDEKRAVSLPFMAWSDVKPGYTVGDLLVPGETGMWVRLSVSKEGNTYVNPKQAQSAQIQRLKAEEIVQGHVLNVNTKSRTVLLDVDGVRTLVDNTDLIWGAPPERASVEPGMWMAVRVQSVAASYPSSYQLIVSGRATSNALDHLRVKEKFEAVVLYTLPHGLVFSYRKALGYIPNSQLAWSDHASAQAMFKPGKHIAVYKRFDCTQRFPFSLKDLSQIANLRIGDEVEAIILSKVETGIYVEATNMFAFVSRYQLGSRQLETLTPTDKIVLKCEQVNTSRMVAVFRVKQEESDTLQDEPTVNTEIVEQMLDFYYASTFNRFSSLVRDKTATLSNLLNQSFESTDGAAGKQSPLSSTHKAELTAGDYLVELLNQHKIPCTYRNIRMLLAFLWRQPYWQPLLKQLAEVKVNERDHTTALVLCQVARELTEGNEVLDSLTGYAVGMMAFAPKNTPSVSIEPTTAIEYLLHAYRFDKSLDVEIALMVLYEEIGNSTVCRMLLRHTVSRLAGNAGWLLKLPLPLELEISYYSQLFRSRIPGLNQYVSDIASDMSRMNTLLKEGKLRDAERELKDRWARVRKASVEMVELDLNLVLCRVLQQDFEGARTYLDGAGDILKQGRYDHILPMAHESYYQLAMYVHYHLGDFPQLQAIAEERYRQDAEQWLETLLGYMFFASENYKLSREVAQHTKLSAQPNLENLLQPEQILLALYWEPQEANFKRGMKLLRETLFYRYCIGEYNQSEDKDVWLQTVRKVRLFPEPQHLQFKGLVRFAQELDAPDYILHEYYKDPNLQAELSNWEIASALIDLTLRKLEPPTEEELSGSLQEESTEPIALQEALKLLDEYFSRQVQHEASSLSATNVASFYQSLYLTDRFNEFKRKNRGVNWREVVRGSDRMPARRELIERWMKSPYDQELIGRKLIALLQASPELSKLYWDKQELRDQIWEALDLCMDYGALADLVPEELSLAALEDIVFHSLSLGLNRYALHLIHRKKRTTLDEAAKAYLDELLKTCEQEGSAGFKTILPSLLVRSPERSLEFYAQPKMQRRSAISVLQVLIKYPDAARQIPMMLLLGELYEIEKQYIEASQLYSKIAFELAEAAGVSPLLAVLRLLRLYVLHQTVRWPAERIVDWSAGQPLFAPLFLELKKIADGVQTPIERLRLAELLGRLQVVIEMSSQKGERYDSLLSQLEALLHVLFQITVEHKLLVVLYKCIIRTDPLEEWYVNQVQRMLYLFADYAMARGIADQLKDTVDLTLAATITRYEVTAKTGRQTDVKNLEGLRQLQQNLMDLREWLSPYTLIQMPEQIEPHAHVVLEFLSAGERLSKQALQEATTGLERMMGTTSEHYGPAMSMLIARRFLEEGEWQRARTQAIDAAGVGTPRGAGQSEEILLEIVFDSLARNDIEVAKQVRAEMTQPQMCYEVDQLIKLLEQQPVRDEGKVILQKIRESLKFMKEHEQVKMIYRYLQRLREKIKDIDFTDDIWQQYLKYAIESDIPPKEGLAAAEEVYQALRHPSLLLTAPQIIRYVCHHTKADCKILTQFLFSIAKHDLGFSRDPLLKNVLLQELSLLRTQEI